MALELWQKYGMSYKKNTEVEVLPVVDLFQESSFFVGDATPVYRPIHDTRHDTSIIQNKSLIIPNDIGHDYWYYSTEYIPDTYTFHHSQLNTSFIA